MVHCARERWRKEEGRESVPVSWDRRGARGTHDGSRYSELYGEYIRLHPFDETNRDSPAFLVFVRIPGRAAEETIHRHRSATLFPIVYSRVQDRHHENGALDAFNPFRRTRLVHEGQDAYGSGGTPSKRPTGKVDHSSPLESPSKRACVRSPSSKTSFILRPRFPKTSSSSYIEGRTNSLAEFRIRSVVRCRWASCTYHFDDWSC